MTICEIIEKEWKGGAAVLKTAGEEYTLHLSDNGNLHNDKLNIPASVLCGDRWKLYYHKEYPTYKVIDALASLNPPLSDLRHYSDWNSWAWNEAKETIYAVARALNYKIEKMSKVE